MFDFLNGPCSTGIMNSRDAQNAFQPQKTAEQLASDGMLRQMAEMQKIVDAMCKVYVAQHTKDIEGRHPDERYYRTDQPIIDRAKVMELQQKIKVAEMDLRLLKGQCGIKEQA